MASTRFRNASLPLGIQTFADIRKRNQLYVDKTAQIHQLITASKTFFLARPRRFGKSLLISTLESLFKGEKSLFEDLAISKTDYDFTTHPVITLDFSEAAIDSEAEFEEYIHDVVEEYEQLYDVKIGDGSYNARFRKLIKQLNLKYQQQVVLLIDEYDKPILNTLTNNEALSEIKQMTARFFASIKALDKHLRFIFITGVSRFAKVSVFSGMNNLRDISLDLSFAGICGITENELHYYFMPYMQQMAQNKQLEQQQLADDIKHWYNGYRFHQDAQSVYSPYSLLAFFVGQEFKNYWFSTATPTFLIDLFKNQLFDLSQTSNYQIDELSFDATEPEHIQIAPLLLQTGYLTISSYDQVRKIYLLDFPNYEVRYAFHRTIVQSYSGVTIPNAILIEKIQIALVNDDLDELTKQNKVPLTLVNEYLTFNF